MPVPAPVRLAVLPAVLAVAAAVAGPAPPARADLMTACSSEVREFCSDVARGRGRISACLAGRMDRLGAGCRPEVQAVAHGRLVPRDVRKLFTPSFRADLPAACAAPAASLCPGVPQGDGRVFACLYARTDRVGSACSTEAEAALKQSP
jgi:hypothetical protein